MRTIAHPTVARPIRSWLRSLSPLARYWLAAALAFLGVAAGLTVGVDGSPPAVLGGLAIVLVGMVAGFVLWLVTFVKRTPGSPPTL